MKIILELKLFMVVFICAFASCNHEPTFSEKEKTVVMDSVRQTFKNYCLDIRENGLTAEFKYLDNSPDFFWFPPGSRNSISYDSVVTVLKQNAPKYKSVVNAFETLDIIPLSKELATYSGRLKSTIIDTSGKVMNFLMVENGAMVKRGDNWKLLCGQTVIVNQ